MRYNTSRALDYSRGFLKDKECKRVLRFGVTGVINTLVDFVIFSVFVYFGAYYTICQATGYFMGTLNSYILNKFWTFGDSQTGKKTSKELVQFMTINVISFLATLLGLVVLKNSLHLNIYVAKVFTIAIGQAVNFLGYKLWVFNKHMVN